MSLIHLTVDTYKAGTVNGSSFSGNPKILAITFNTPFSDANYQINITGVSSRNYTYTNKTANGFTINTNSNPTFATDVDWSAIKSNNI
jgi:hypothetical protein